MKLTENVGLPIFNKFGEISVLITVYTYLLLIILFALLLLT